jgi:hypothetical protein
MTSIQARLRILGTAAFLAAAMTGCGGSDGSTVPTPGPISEAIPFSVFANQAFSNSANSTPVSVDQNFAFDVNEEPTAFDTLIVAGAY